MTTRAEIAVEAAKATPPAVVVASNQVMGIDISTAVGLATLLYIVLQAIYLLWKWRHEAQDRHDRRKHDIPVECDRRKQSGQVNRYLVSGMALSAAALITLAVSEGFVPEAMIPVRGDPPTVGFGSTVHTDGAPVRMGDRLDPVRALVTLRAHVGRDEAAFQRSLPGVSLTQAEYDLYIDFTYQYGIDAWNKSSMRRHLRAGEYRAACDDLLRYRYASGFDCSTPGNKVCPGVWTRQLDRHAKCVEAQQGETE